MPKPYNKLSKQLAEKFKHCRLLVMDFDGVLTDNKVYSNERGEEMVRCDRSDSLGLEMLRKQTNIEAIILSKEKNKVVSARAKKLKVKCVQGVDNKPAELKKQASRRKINLEQVCFVGNDINDLGCLKLAGLGVAVANSYPEVLAAACFHTANNGGDGAVREICELLLKSKKSAHE